MLKMLFKKKTGWILYIVYVVIMIMAFGQKVNFHEDEYLSYNLANSSWWFTPIDGVIYSPAEEPFMDALVSDGEVNIPNVWARQSNDVHPPFYYVLLHGICSLFPETFSMWYAAVINIVFQLLILSVLRAFLRTLIEEEKIVNMISMAYILCPGILSITTFLRMYVCIMFWIILFTHIIFKNKEKSLITSYVKIGIVTVCGALTHYYFIIYAFFLSMAVCLLALKEKRIKETIKYVITMVCAGGISIVIFPAIITHMFRSNRGVQTIENLKSSDIVAQLKIYFELLNDNLFGDLLVLALGLILVAMVIKVKRVGVKELCDREKKYICLLFAVSGYVFFIAKSAPLNEMRYLSPMFVVLYATFFVILYRCIRYLLHGKQYINCIYAIIVAVILLKGWHHYQWEYLYRDTLGRMEYASQEGSQSTGICVYIYDWAVLHSYLEISQLENVIFYKANNYDEYMEKSDGVELADEITFLIVGTDGNTFIDKFMEEHQEYVMKKDNGQFKYTHSYYLEKNEGK